MGKEIKQLGSFIDSTEPKTQIAIIYSYESRWAMKAGRFGSDFDPVEEAITYHRALARRQTSIDAMDPRQDLSQYRLVIAPRLWIVDEAIVLNLHQFVQNGGTLVLTPGSGVADPYGKSFVEPRPGPLRYLAGITVSDLAYQTGMKLAIQSHVIPGLKTASGYNAADEIHIEAAKVVATYGNVWRDGRPAITMNNVGNGQVIYIGTLLEEDTLKAVINWLCDLARVKQSTTAPDGVSVYERQSGNTRLLFLINWRIEQARVDVGDDWNDAFTQQPVKSVLIESQDIRILLSDTI
jgi:beta-galactosidase